MYMRVPINSVSVIIQHRYIYIELLMHHLQPVPVGNIYSSISVSDSI